MRVVLFTGARVIVVPAPVFLALDELAPDLVIHGTARGGDTAADAWARISHRDVISIEAEWTLHGKSAGARRNQRLVAKTQQYVAAGHDVVCLAMPGSRSVGTHDCARRAAKAGIRVILRPV